MAVLETQEYGLGEVVSLYGRGDRLRVEVAFGNLGTRRFVAANAPLKKVRRSLSP